MELPDWNHSSLITAHLWLYFTGYFFLVKKKTEMLEEAQSKVKEFEEKSLPSMK